VYDDLLGGGYVIDSCEFCRFAGLRWGHNPQYSAVEVLKWLIVATSTSLDWPS